MTEYKHVKKHTGGPALRLIALALAVVLMGGIAIGTSDRQAMAEGAGELSAAEIYEANVDSTVGITVKEQSYNYWGQSTSRTAKGSGFIITEDGYILTNYHVVEDGDDVEVALYDGSSYPAEIIGYDESNDVAVLKIEAEGLNPAEIGDSDALRVGDDVLAIGNPLGDLTFSLTKGIVSALNRDVVMESGITMSLIQTDCAINSGNSGGALFNSKGEVIGITNAKYSYSSSGVTVDNICFAIPINSLIKIYNSIIEKGCIETPYIGITGQTVSDEIKGATGIEGGVSVYSVTEDGPAEKAGLQEHDIITAVNGKEISEFADLSSVVDASEPGDVLELSVYRQGKTVEISVEVGVNTKSAKEKEDAEAAAAEEAEKNGNGSNDGQDYYGRNGNGNGYGYYGNGGNSGSSGYGMDDWMDLFRSFGFGF